MMPNKTNIYKTAGVDDDKREAMNADDDDVG